MGNRNSNGKFPNVVIDKTNNFAAIKLKDGIESLSYLKDGVLFSEDSSGNIIEIQILDLTSLAPHDESSTSSNA